MGAPEVPAWPERLLDTGDHPFIGRSWELDELRSAWEQAGERRRRVVLIGGEPGLGKSHLASTAARWCHDHGAFVTVGSSFDELSVPFQPIAEILSQILDPRHGVVQDLPGHTIDELSRFVTGLPPSDAVGAGDRLGASDDRRQLFDAVVHAVQTASQRWPLVLIVDDLHWAGRPSLELLDHVIRSTAAERLLILATYRTTAPDHSDELGRAIGGMIRHRGVDHLELVGLTHDDVVGFLLAHGTDERHARRFAAELHRQTGGNPFLLRELWRHLEAHGGFEQLDGSGPPLPRSIGDTIELRLRSLASAHLDVLELAAIVGHHGDAATLVAAGDADLETTLAAVGDGVDVGVLRFTDPATMSYTFVHDLARHVLIDRLRPADRARLHARVAAALERSGRAIDRRASRLAHHWLEAGLYAEGRAVNWLVEAGRDAEHSLAFEEAAAFFERASALVDVSDERYGDLLLTAAANAVRSGSFADGRRLYARLADHVDPVVVARAAVGYEDSCWRPGLSDERAAELLERAARVLSSDHPLRVRVLASLGRALSFLGRWDQALMISDAAIESARIDGDDELLAHALQASLWVRSGDPSGAQRAWLDREREAVELAERLGDMELLGQAATYRGSLAYGEGRPAEWRAARRQLEVARRGSAQPFYAYMAGCSDYAEAYLRGDFDEAAHIVEELLEVGSAFGQDDTEGLYGLQSFMIRRATGKLEAIRPMMSGDEPLDGRFWAPGLLALYTELGLHEAARRVLDHILRSNLDNERHSSQWPAVVAFLADAVTDLGDEIAARMLLPYVEQFAGTNLSAGHFVAVHGSADRYVAMLLGVIGSPDVDARFEAALAMDRHMNAPVHVAETLARWADATQDRDPDAAAQRRAEAHEIAERIGMVPLAQRTEPALHPDAGGSPVAVDHDTDERPDGLSRREIEVLRCIARGCSNREIAAELFIAENTAANHVRSIMMKTGSANRTQAAIYAARRSLV